MDSYFELDILVLTYKYFIVSHFARGNKNVARNMPEYCKWQIILQIRESAENSFKKCI